MDNFSTSIIRWYKRHGRHDLPWQHAATPYHVWVSEIMLQQTQVNTVIPYYMRFVDRFPDVQSLANAGIDEVLSYWAGLGYYARGRNLHRTAKIIHDDFGGELPCSMEKLISLPGIGRSTAGAIMALAFNQRHAILDGNVKRVLSRFYAISGWPGEAGIEQQMWQLADSLTPERNVALYTQAIMDLGATVCTRAQPGCNRCPVTKCCLARQQSKQHKYPASKPKKTMPLRKMVFLLLENRAGELLFQRRPSKGIWGGMWCFPECPDERDLEKWVFTRMGFRSSFVRQLAVIKHTLTHFRLEILPVHLKVEQCHNVAVMKDHQWCLVGDAFKFGTPTPVRNLLLAMTE